MNARLGEVKEVPQLVDAIYKSVPRNLFSLHVTGGAVQAIQWLLTVPGASSCLLSAEVPYSRAALQQLLAVHSTVNPSGIDTSCSAETALAMAKASFARTADILLCEGHDGTCGVGERMQQVSTVFGVGCTASLVSDVTKKGPHRCHVAVYSVQNGGTTYSVELHKGLRDRVSEDFVCSRMILDAIALQVGLNQLPNSPLHLLTTGIEGVHSEQAQITDVSSAIDSVSIASGGVFKEEMVQVSHTAAPDVLENIYQRTTKHALFIKKHKPPSASAVNSNSNTKSSIAENYWCFEDAVLPVGTLVYPGSFNPVHEGHLALAKAEIDRLRLLHSQSKQSTESDFIPPLVVFEIGALNPDKPALSREDIMRRLDQFDYECNPLLRAAGISNFAVSITSEPLFVQKSDIFKGCSFLIGADTMTRLLNAKYYIDKAGSIGGSTVGFDKSANNMISALSKISANKCKFIVGGRTKSILHIVGTVAAAQSSSRDSYFETCETILHGHAFVGNSENKGDIPLASILPQNIMDLFVGLSEEQFRLDISSTEIRNRSKPT